MSQEQAWLGGKLRWHLEAEVFLRNINHSYWGHWDREQRREEEYGRDFT